MPESCAPRCQTVLMLRFLASSPAYSMDTAPVTGSLATTLISPSSIRLRVPRLRYWTVQVVRFFIEWQDFADTGNFLCLGIDVDRVEQPRPVRAPGVVAAAQ